MEEALILVLGPGSSGKTLMLKRLQTVSSQMNLPPSQRQKELGEAPPTIPTVGVNLVTVNFLRKKFTFRELGGAMAPIWSNYLKEAAFLIYIFDIANRFQISASCILLLEVLASKETQDMPVLLVFNKIDSPGCMSIAEVASLIRLEDIKAHAKQDLTAVEASFRTGQGMDDVLQWIKAKAGPKKRGSFQV
ncbi:predicted protein [Nematostella vectensis]|uniref:ADP-ribosylation factor-like protein 16 n=1 Tax=Nematostella vectensis TaxID=45351 RepID=A7RNQ2_NEMVE|nr:predicted protein [Nematostella vectensis]|eukprot:XP_001639030.1 predicted protein [Nematostella vectensis]